MDVRSMQYFLAIAREGSFTKAAEVLHMTQPPLSRQMQELEAELGVALFDRSGKGVTLTEEGLVFRERAQEVVDLMSQVESDMKFGEGGVAGDVRIACGESDAVTLLAEAAKRLQYAHPRVSYRLLSGDRDFVQDRLDGGAADFGLLVVSQVDSDRYDFLRMPMRDRWGVLVGAGDELAKLTDVTPADLVGRPLMLPYRAAMGSDLMAWFGEARANLDVVATYDLAYNASRFAKVGFGCAVALDGIVDAGAGSGLVFRPLHPTLEADLFLVWRRNQRLSRAARVFMEEMRRLVGEASTCSA